MDSNRPVREVHHNSCDRQVLCGLFYTGTKSDMLNPPGNDEPDCALQDFHSITLHDIPLLVSLEDFTDNIFDFLFLQTEQLIPDPVKHYDNMGDIDDIDGCIAIIRTGDVKARREAVKTVTDFGNEAVDPLIGALITADENDVRWYLARALGMIGVPAIDSLIYLITVSEDTDTAKYAAAALGEMGEATLEPLIELLDDEDPKVRGFAALALGRMGKPAIKRLTTVIEESDGLKKSCAKMALFRMGGEGTEALARSIMD